MGTIDCQILIGTPKEVASLGIIRVFNIEDISLCVFDDADVVATTNFIKTNVIDRLKRCRMLFLSSVCLNSVKNNLKKSQLIIKKTTMNAVQYFMKISDISEKIAAIVKIYNLLTTPQRQCIVFFNVSFRMITRSTLMNIYN